MTHLGLVARLVAPAVAAAAASGGPLGLGLRLRLRLPLPLPLPLRLRLRLGEMWWQDVLGGPVPLSVPSGPDDSLTAPGVLDELIDPLTAQVLGLVSVSPRVLWGNVASAVNGAAAQIAAQRPDLSRPAWAAASAMFASPRLGRERQPPGPAFRRSSCCLIYKISGRREDVCGDCVLRR